MSRAVTSAKDTALSLAKTAAKASGVPGMLRGGAIGALRDQFEVAKELFYAPPAAMIEKALQSETLPEAAAYGASALLPVVGPMAAHVGESIGEDKLPELAGELAVGSALPIVAKGAPPIIRGAARTVRSAAESELLARIARRSARPVGATVGAGVGGVIAGPGGATAGAVVGSEVGDMIRRSVGQRKPAPVAGDAPVAPKGNPYADVDSPPPPAYAPPPAPAVEAPPLVAERVPDTVKAAPTAKPRPSPAQKSAAEALRDKIDAKEVKRIEQALGTRVTLLRRVKENGIEHPVYAVAPEFLEQAQMMGLRAEPLSPMTIKLRAKAK